jgi:hypothetical protein
MALPLTVQFNTHDEADTPVFEQGNNWENNIVWDSTRSVPQANYQGERVNFSQPSNQAFQGLVMEVGKINSLLYKYPQDDNLASAKSDTDIWNHINRYIWGKSGSQSSPKGNWQADTNAIVPNITKNTNSIKQMEAKIKSNKDEHGYFHDTLTELVKHSHGNGNGKDCGWFGEKCWDFDLGLGISLTTMAAIGVGAYLLTRKK